MSEEKLREIGFLDEIAWMNSETLEPPKFENLELLLQLYQIRKALAIEDLDSPRDNVLKGITAFTKGNIRQGVYNIERSVEKITTPQEAEFVQRVVFEAGLIGYSRQIGDEAIDRFEPSYNLLVNTALMHEEKGNTGRALELILQASDHDEYHEDKTMKAITGYLLALEGREEEGLELLETAYVDDKVVFLPALEIMAENSSETHPLGAIMAANLLYENSESFHHLMQLAAAAAGLGQARLAGSLCEELALNADIKEPFRAEAAYQFFRAGDFERAGFNAFLGADLDGEFDSYGAFRTAAILESRGLSRLAEMVAKAHERNGSHFPHVYDAIKSNNEGYTEAEILHLEAVIKTSRSHTHSPKQHLGLLYAQSGRVDEAIDLWQEAIDEVEAKRFFLPRGGRLDYVDYLVAARSRVGIEIMAPHSFRSTFPMPDYAAEAIKEGIAKSDDKQFSALLV